MSRNGVKVSLTVNIDFSNFNLLSILLTENFVYRPFQYSVLDGQISFTLINQDTLTSKTISLFFNRINTC